MNNDLKCIKCGHKDARYHFNGDGTCSNMYRCLHRRVDKMEDWIAMQKQDRMKDWYVGEGDTKVGGTD